jgi:hypothetical protein
MHINMNNETDYFMCLPLHSCCSAGAAKPTDAVAADSTSRALLHTTLGATAAPGSPGQRYTMRRYVMVELTGMDSSLRSGGFLRYLETQDSSTSTKQVTGGGFAYGNYLNATGSAVGYWRCDFASAYPELDINLAGQPTVTISSTASPSCSATDYEGAALPCGSAEAQIQGRAQCAEISQESATCTQNDIGPRSTVTTCHGSCNAAWPAPSAHVMVAVDCGRRYKLAANHLSWNTAIVHPGGTARRFSRRRQPGP